MIYKRISPGTELKNFVKYFWILEGDKATSDSGNEIISPDGSIELIFHYGDKFKKYNSRKVFEFQSRSILGGQLNKFITLQPAGTTGIIAVKFFPAGAFPFFQIPLSEFKNQTEDLSLLYPKQVRELSEKIRNSKNTNERIYHLYKFLKERLNNFKVEDRLSTQAVSFIIHHKGKVPVNNITKHFCISSKHLERKFNEQIGLTPKEFSRIVRFRYALQLLEGKRYKHLSEISAEAGFYDQAHFIHEFQNFSGTNPQNYFNKLRLISTLINS